MKPIIGIVLSMFVSACVTPLSARPTRDIYEEAVQISGYGFICSARDGVWFDQRLQPLVPWLEAQLGKDHVVGVLTGMEQSLGTTDFTTCPTRAERVRSRIQARRRLRHLEARSRR